MLLDVQRIQNGDMDSVFVQGCRNRLVAASCRFRDDPRIFVKRENDIRHLLQPDCGMKAGPGSNAASSIDRSAAILLFP